MPFVPSEADRELCLMKQRQATAYLAEQDIDLWLIFVREGGESTLTSLIAGSQYVVQNAALIITRTGRTIAMLEPIDVQNGVGSFFQEVVQYRNDIANPLKELLGKLAPRKIAFNYSKTDYGADGLTYGMYLRLIEMLGEDEFKRLAVSAEGLIARIMAVKNEEEVGRLTEAARITDRIGKDLQAFIRPGMTEAELSAFVAARAVHYGADEASASVCANPQGENAKGPKARPIQSGDCIVSDMGATYKGYGADLKRIYYVLRPGETSIPADLAKQWSACQAALEASRVALVPGTWGYEVDEQGWSTMETHGYVRDGHAWGHQIGRRAHDPGVWLGPRGNPYRPSEGQITNDMVFTLDPTVNRVGLGNPGAWCMGMEEMAVVTPTGGRLLSEPQVDIYCVRSDS